MEKIRVNMTPCEEVKTIHASQNDNATRKWAFDLYDENGKIDSSDIKEQMIFDSRVGGTEQILPENTSDPTTSPIIADIQYPDSLRSEQTFLYRESPTQQDGQAKITRIKGNTVVFNQLVQNGNFADTSGISATSNITISTNNNILSVQNTASDDGGRYAYQTISNIVQGHKYFIKFSANVGSSTESVIFALTGSLSITAVGNSVQGWKTQSQMANASATGTAELRYRNAQHGTTNQYRNVMIWDLTHMGIDNLTTTTEVEAWLSSHIGNLPYYDYTTGKLLPFKGEELKTTGKNLLPLTMDVLKARNTFGTWNGDVFTARGITFTFETENGLVKSITMNGTATSQMNFSLNDFYSLPKGSYIISSGSDVHSNSINITNWNGSAWAGSTASTGNLNITINSGDQIRQDIYIANGFVASNVVYYPMLRLSSVSDNTFEPYTSSTINLPTLNYFPSGMKDCSQRTQVFDEMSESKAITRVGLFQITSSNIVSDYLDQTNNQWLGHAVVNDIKQQSGQFDVANIVCNSLITKAQNVLFNETGSAMALLANSTNVRITINGVATFDAMKTWLDNNPTYFYYELATPTETTINTASLVTEKGEAPLYYDDELIADCNETISSESGIFDAKIKLMDDNTIYSQKIQLHIERKPQ